MVGKRGPTIERLMAKVEKTPTCWLWTASKNNAGYGMIWSPEYDRKVLAHRFVYEHHHGRIPDGGLILHSCDNPACVNPDHLRLGDHKENVADMDKRGRRVVGVRRGEDNAQTTMSDFAVTNIRLYYVNGASVSAITSHFGISDAAFRDYVSGRSFAHILGKNGCPTLEQLKAEAARRMRSNARLTREDAETIRKRIAAGARGIDLAAEYGVHKATISDIKQRKIWP
jgi:hypothetical protein